MSKPGSKPPDAATIALRNIYAICFAWLSKIVLDIGDPASAFGGYAVLNAPRESFVRSRLYGIPLRFSRGFFYPRQPGSDWLQLQVICIWTRIAAFLCLRCQSS
jgi:hypothetical protein